MAGLIAPPTVMDLVERFARNRDDYHSGRYNEAQVRREFIDPFFKALGWDVDNERGYAEAYKDVIHEDSIKVGSLTKAPDYCFRIGGTRKFFLEAKKPSVSLKDDVSPAYQLRRYAWSAKLPLSILTDFEEFAVFDCRPKPSLGDKPSTSRTMYLTYDQYVERWGDIAGIFGREAVLQGSFDRYVESNRAKRGTAEVDDAFLEEISAWREELARHLALRNRELTSRELNYAVQQTIDRIIFLRIAEDRGLEVYGRLLGLVNGGQVYERLLQLYTQADQRYNSGLFHFQHEKGRAEAPDTLSYGLRIDDKVLAGILKRLYYPDSPYEFSVLPPDILGQVYEQFLGKVIRLTPGHTAKVEEKPEVKKAGGVYYTPTYIVDYIVEHTVGELCRGKTPAEVAKLRIVDPACGSGSFLLGAYQYLLDWHLKWYLENDPEKWARRRRPPIYRIGSTAVSVGDAAVRPPDSWALTLAERKRILLDNLYGVDIDTQAVEVTKLSLLLKVLEGDTARQAATQLAFLHERALPDLGRNIKCGNSLIGSDYYEGRQGALFDDEDVHRVNAFDWEKAFPEVFARGGFDAVIGNPPYIRIQTLKEWAPLEVEFYRGRYRAASKGNYDIYVVFVEKGLSLLNDRGRLGFILPHKFFNAQYGRPLRTLLAEGKHLAKVVHFGDQQVFAGATTYTCLLFLDKAGADAVDFTRVTALTAWRVTGEGEQGTIEAERVQPAEWNFVIGHGADLFRRLSEIPVKLGDVASTFVGLQTDADDVFIVTPVGTEGDMTLCRSAHTLREHWLETAHLKHLLKGSLNIRRYQISGTDRFLVFPYEVKHGKSLLLDPGEYRSRFPATWAYLAECRSRLAGRNKGRMGGEWYGYVYKKNHVRFEQPKLVVPSIGAGACFAIDSTGEWYFVGSGGGGGGAYAIIPNQSSHATSLALLGCLNSAVLNWWLRATSTPFRGGYIALNRQYIERLPIRAIDFSSPADVARHDQMVALVERMLDLHKRLAEARVPVEKEQLQRQIDATDREIDRLVYELYELTPAEIAVVEGNRA